jgi:hypothetical protein
VFTFGAPAYLRYLDQMHREKMVMVVSLGLQGRSTVLGLRWTDAAQEVAVPPNLGARVQCLAIVSGVLYTAIGRLSGVIMGAPLQLHVAVESKCHGLNLRRHVRFSAQGTLSITRPKIDLAPREFVPLALDISLGGFGAVLGDGGWHAGETVRFDLVFAPVPWPGNHLEFSYLTLAGTCVIRKRAPHPGSNLVRIGCQFAEISQEEHDQLRLLLSTHGTALRAGEI